MIYLFQFNDVDLFYWIDSAGSNHSFRELESSKICDDKGPVLLEETAEVKDKSMLPILGFSYGSMTYQGQQLNVSLVAYVSKH